VVTIKLNGGRRPLDPRKPIHRRPAVHQDSGAATFLSSPLGSTLVYAECRSASHSPGAPVASRSGARPLQTLLSFRAQAACSLVLKVLVVPLWSPKGGDMGNDRQDDAERRAEEAAERAEEAARRAEEAAERAEEAERRAEEEAQRSLPPPSESGEADSGWGSDSSGD